MSSVQPRSLDVVRLYSFFLCCVSSVFIAQQVTPCSGWVKEECNTSKPNLPEIKSGKTINAQTSIQRNNFRFSWTVRDLSLFLAHPTYGNERSTSESTKIITEIDLESSLRNTSFIFMELLVQLWVLWALQYEPFCVSVPYLSPPVCS